MLITVDLSKDDMELLKGRQVFRMQWIKSGADKIEPLDIVIQKVINAATLSKVDMSS